MTEPAMLDCSRPCGCRVAVSMIDAPDYATFIAKGGSFEFVLCSLHASSDRLSARRTQGVGRGKQMKYRKRPVEVEAVRWEADAQSFYRIANMASGDSARSGTVTLPRIKELHMQDADDLRVKIETLEGTMYAEVGDWIVRGIKGEAYPVKPDIFDLTYEQIEESN